MARYEAVFEGSVLPEWIDYNGHMNDACYVVVFSKAIDGFIDLIGMNEQFRTRHNLSIYTLQSMVHYLQEVGEGAPLRVAARVLESDAKKIRLFLTMYHADRGETLAAMETLLLHMDMTSHRATPFLAEIKDRLDALERAQRDAPYPELAGRAIQLRRA